MAPTSAERGREVRQRLVRAAAELVAERGWAAVSTRMLAERAGVAAGLVHYHFASVHAVLQEAALGVMRAAVDELVVELERADGPDAALDLILSAVDAYTGDDPASLVVVETFLAAARDDELCAAVAEVLTDVRQQLTAVLDAHGVGQPERTAAVLLATVDGVLLHRALARDLDAASVAPVLRRLLTG